MRPIESYLRPLPKLLDQKDAILRTRERDIAHLRKTGEKVLLIGREPLLSQVENDLNEAGIPIKETIVVPGEGPTAKAVLNQLTRGKDGVVVVATPDVVKTVRGLVILDRFDYAFASFALAHQ